MGSRYYSFNTNGKITVHHEFGHIVHNNLNHVLRNQWDDIAKAWANSEEYNILNATQAWTDHYAEAFAEAWGCYMADDKSRLPNNIIKFIEDLL